MSAERPHKPNTGVLFPKKPEWTAEKAGRPASMGEVTIACPTCNCTFRKRVAGWTKQNQHGSYQSLAFNEPVAPAGDKGKEEKP